MRDETERYGVYGAPPDELVQVPLGALQLSPLDPAAAGPALESLDEADLDGLTVLAPPGTIERRYVLALGLRALKPGGRLSVLAPKTKGGSRLRPELESFGCALDEASRRHYRICETVRPLHVTGLAAAIADGAPRLVPGIGLWSQPGLFSWDRTDPGSALLARHLPALSGEGADFGCGAGVLAHAILASPKVKRLVLADLDRRAVECARRNVTDPRAAFLWVDLRDSSAALDQLHFVVMNPPFHDQGTEDKSLGQTFIRRASAALRRGGHCWLVANRHLPYEAILAECFTRVTPVADEGGYKIYEARR